MSIGNISSDSESYEYYEPSSGQWNSRSVTIENASNSNLTGRVVLCGEKCNGEATLHAMVDTDDNKSVDLEVEVESESGRFSGSVSGGVSQDRDGNTSGKVEIDGSIKF